jgi:hypothetical protein
VAGPALPVLVVPVLATLLRALLLLLLLLLLERRRPVPGSPATAADVGTCSGVSTTPTVVGAGLGLAEWLPPALLLLLGGLPTNPLLLAAAVDGEATTVAVVVTLLRLVDTERPTELPEGRLLVNGALPLDSALRDTDLGVLEVGGLKLPTNAAAEEGVVALEVVPVGFSKGLFAITGEVTSGGGERALPLLFAPPQSLLLPPTLRWGDCISVTVVTTPAANAVAGSADAEVDAETGVTAAASGECIVRKSLAALSCWVSDM